MVHAADLKPATAKQQNYRPDPHEFVKLMATAIAFVRGSAAMEGTTTEPADHTDL